jgi:hypothetical protein
VNSPKNPFRSPATHQRGVPPVCTFAEVSIRYLPGLSYAARLR